jgi:tubulin-specific chaperone E
VYVFEFSVSYPVSKANTASQEGLSRVRTAGSFVRPNRPSEYPRSFLEALNHKYASDGPHASIGAGDQSWSLVEHKESVTKPIMISGKIAEEVGFDKIRRQLADLHELRIVILDGLNISQNVQRLVARERPSVEWDLKLGGIRRVSPKISELDLSRNLLQDWHEVTFICSQLASLKNLRLE